MESRQNDFSQGSIPKHILNIAGPMIIAQLINVLYNVIDRIYIGRLPKDATLAMGGLGLCLPIISIIIAFANLYGMGGSPLCSIARGRGDLDEAEEIMGNAFSLLVMTSVVIVIGGLIFKEKLLWLFGASIDTLPYARGYLGIYLLGTPFVLIGLGMNSFINSQGFAKIGMLSVLVGAVTNIILDPILIFKLSFGVQGAAIASVLSQFLSALWTVSFLVSKRTILKLRWSRMHLKIYHVKKIVSLGMAGFMMGLTNSVVSIVCNKTLQTYGGDMYIAIMTILNSIREIIMLPSHGVASASQPVLGFNYGAKKYQRVLDGIKFVTILSFMMGFVLWLTVTIFPNFYLNLFNCNAQMYDLAKSALRLYFFGFFMMAFQSTGQQVAVALGKSKQAIFFSLFRKVMIVAPLTVILPKYIGINGVFIAEAISNFIGGGACYITMLLTIGKDLKRLNKQISN